MRQHIGPKVRFEVFKRDNRTCRYCGHSPPDVKLEVDHVVPVCEGGTNDVANLVTACTTCNRGKSGNSLDDKIQTVDEQVRELLNMFRYQLNVEGDEATIRRFLDRLPVARLHRAVHITKTSRHAPRDGEGRWRYFCGICWRYIREKDAA